MRGGVRQYSWIIDLVGIFFCALFLARITSVYVGKALEVPRSVGVVKASDIAPVERKHVDETEYETIIARNMFDSTPVASETSGAEQTGQNVTEMQLGEAVLTSLNIKVLGVLVVGDGKDPRSTATVSGGGGGSAPAKPGEAKKSSATGEAKVYAVGDEESFAPNTKLMRVQPDRIEFINNGRLEYAEVLAEELNIFNPPPTTTVAAADKKPEKTDKDVTIKKDDTGKFTVDKRELDDALQDINKLLMEMRAVPNFVNGKLSGIKVLSINSNSIFAKLGLRRGDILQKINGMEMNMQKGVEMFSQLKDQKSITLDLVRGGQPTTMEYEIR